MKNLKRTNLGSVRISRSQVQLYESRHFLDDETFVIVDSILVLRPFLNDFMLGGNMKGGGLLGGALAVVFFRLLPYDRFFVRDGLALVIVFVLK